MIRSSFPKVMSYELFQGYEGEDAEAFIQKINWTSYDRGKDIDADRLHMMDMLLSGQAWLWWEGIPKGERNTWQQAIAGLRAQFERRKMVEKLW